MKRYKNIHCVREGECIREIMRETDTRNERERDKKKGKLEKKIKKKVYQPLLIFFHTVPAFFYFS